jgi:drug/metabolite transporter (DMT)-like permease
MNPFDYLDPLLSAFIDVRGPKQVVLLLVVSGYMGKMLPEKCFPNYLIPWFNCMIIGPFLSVFLLGWPSSGDVDPAVRWPDFAAWVYVVQRGIMLAIVAWLTHGLLLKKILDKNVGAWKPELTEAEKVQIAAETTTVTPP